MKTVLALVVLSGLAVSTANVASAAITIPTVSIGHQGNTADPTTGNLYGSVAYTYSIGTTEVTNTQYVAFLNAVAATDTFNLYNANMGTNARGGITRSGSSGSYTYAPITGRENNPVNFVSFWDACRFANWLHNGQPTGPQGAGTTESGAYTLGSVTSPTNASVTRNAGWQWAIASENEWYKAAYYQPASQGGDADNYWLYPTSSNSVPTTAQANFNSTGLRPVGSYAANFYGTFDMGGNVFEWNEAIISTSRGLRGGAFSNVDTTGQRASQRGQLLPNLELEFVGFRVVQVPSPSAAVVLVLGGMGVLRRRR